MTLEKKSNEMRRNILLTNCRMIISKLRYQARRDCFELLADGGGGGLGCKALAGRTHCEVGSSQRQ
jgi:hypothetical protein